MATKKQKREAALAKRAAFEAEVRADGLMAIEKARKRREQRQQEQTESETNEKENS